MYDSPTRRVRVLVTGASGRIGRHVVDALVADHEVTVLDLAPPVQDVRFIEGDVLDLAKVRASMAGQDAVIHLAAIDFGVPAEPEAYFGVNVMGTWNTVQAARDAGIRKVVLASSVSAVGVGEMRPDFPAGVPAGRRGAPDEAGPCLRREQAGGPRTFARGFALHGDISITCLRPVAVVVESNLQRTVDRAADPRPPVARVPTSPARTPAAPSPPRSTTTRRSTRCSSPPPIPPPRCPTVERLAGVFGSAAPVHDPGWFERDPRASPIDATRATERLRWRPTSTWAEVAARVGP